MIFRSVAPAIFDCAEVRLRGIRIDQFFVELVLLYKPKVLGNPPGAVWCFLILLVFLAWRVRGLSD